MDEGWMEFTSLPQMIGIKAAEDIQLQTFISNV